MKLEWVQSRLSWDAQHRGFPGRVIGTEACSSWSVLMCSYRGCPGKVAEILAVWGQCFPEVETCLGQVFKTDVGMGRGFLEHSVEGAPWMGGWSLKQV